MQFMLPRIKTTHINTHLFTAAIELLKCQLKQNLFSGTRKDSYSGVFYDIALLFATVTAVELSRKRIATTDSVWSKHREKKIIVFLNLKNKVKLDMGAKWLKE